MTTHPRPAVTFRAAYHVALLAASALMTTPAPAQETEPPERGMFVTVTSPITSEVVNGVRERVARAQRDKPVTKVVFDFNPDGKEASSGDFFACAGLAKDITRLPVKTIAFVHAPVTRHSVLPVLACQQLVMSSDAVLGPVLTDPNTPPDADELAHYARVAGKAREALVLKMLDRSVAVLEGRLPNGAVTYFDARKRADAEREGVAGVLPEPVLPAGAVAKYDADEALRYGLAQAKLESKQEVAERFQLPPLSLREDPLQGRVPEAWLIKVQGPIDRGLAETLRRKIARATRQGANILFLQLEAAGGEFDVARDLAQDFINLKGPDGLPVMTVAYIPHAAPDTATFLALGCTEIVMGKGATMGQFRHLMEPPPNAVPFGGRGRRPQRPPPPAVDLGLIGKSLADLAQERGYPPLVFRALVDPSLEVWRVTSKKGSAGRAFVTREELDADRKGEQKWAEPALVKPAGQFFELTAERAKDYGIAQVVTVADPPRELYEQYGVSRAKEPPADWLDKLAAFLSDPVVAMFLVILGVTCLILELKMPGVGVPGVIAAVCFVLFFWSQTQLNGQMTLLAVLLFLLGLVLIGIEIFLIPGFGVTGISGILLVLAGLGLATVERLPQTSQEAVDFGFTLLKFGGAMVGATAAAFVVAHFLPSIPYANRLMLSPPGEKEGTEDATAATGTYEALTALLGAVGTAATVLRPAGMARFGDAYVDVVSEGNYIPAGARVQVIEIEGNRVVVKEV
ncbi:MAG TPA: NfeD family protein [Gemmataceae bacterium]|jgi:membrane-bound ClpP family serine protease